MKMIKISHLTSVHPLEDVRIFTKECTSLAAHGFDVTLIACGDTAFEDVKNGVKRISLKVPVKNRMQRFLKRSKAVYKKALELDADIYHFHDPELLPVGLKLKRKGKKVIFDSHEFYGEQIKEKKYIPVLFRYLAAALYMRYEAYVCKRIDAVVQVCTLAGQDYFEQRARKSIFIANTPRHQEGAFENAPSFNHRKSITHIGSLNHNRGITHLIKAAYIANVNLVLAGNFSSNAYHEELKNMDEYKNIDYKGYIPSDQIYDVHRQCFAGISTLLHVGQYNKVDNVSTKVYEYMAAGIPIIISNTNYVTKLIEKYKFGIAVDPANVDEIAQAITYLKDHKDIASQMGKNGRKAFEEEFNWTNEERKLVRLYHSL